jgi:phosphoribosyl 1,2-cyclic phosphodiesterase
MAIRNRLVSLYSGSSGNCTLVEVAGRAFLFDMGWNCRPTVASLVSAGIRPDEIDAVFVTHEHIDHRRGIPAFAKQFGVPVHMTAPSASAGYVPNPVCHPILYEAEFGGVCVRSFFVPHDSRACVGYVGEGGGFKFGVATDMGHVTQPALDALRGCDAVLIESNHDPEMLRLGPYPADLKARIAGRYGHLPNAEAASLAADLAAAGTRAVMLAHLSAENNRPALARSAARAELDRRGLDAFLAVAERGGPTEFIMED